LGLFNTYQFANPEILWGLLAIPFIICWYIITRKNKAATLATSSYKQISDISSGFLPKLHHLFFGTKTIAIGLFIIALARPQLNINSDSYIEQFSEGIDIVVAMDASGSMLATDFKPDRFEASKSVAKDFIAKRKNDRIGLVVFQAESYTQCPLTTDNRIVLELLEEMQRDVVPDGTAVGMGLATAVNRLRESTAPSRVIILLTDGVNRNGKIHPLTAAEMAKEFGIRVYTIGVGTNGKARMPVGINPINNKYVYDMVDVEIDEKTLAEISSMTGGKYFRATDNEKLKAIYDEIDLLETEKIKSIEYEVDLPEKNLHFLLFGLGLLLFEFLIKSTILKGIS
jgi:Ca-activated chloride channel family protein